MTESTDTQVELSPQLLKQFVDMVGVIPDYESGGGEGILEAILTAKKFEEVDAPWKGGRELPVGRNVVVIACYKAPSDYPGGLPFFLVLDCIDVNTGEIKQYQIGATSVVAQMVRYHALSAFPIGGSAVEAKKRSKNGYLPVHWEYDKEFTDYAREQLSKKAAK